MRVLLLAGGIGSRLRPLTEKIPKCLVPINSKPLLGIWLDQLAHYGYGPFLVNTHHFADKVTSFVKGNYHRNSIKIVHEPKLLGTAGTVWKNKSWFKGEPFMVVHADNYCVCDLGKFRQAHFNKPKETVMTMMTFETDTPETCGIVQLSPNGVVINMQENKEEFRKI